MMTDTIGLSGSIAGRFGACLMAEPLLVADCVAAMRDAVGDDIDLMVDCHARPSPAMGMRFAKALDPYELYFFEEPCWPESIDALARINAAVTTPIATGERLTTKYEFARVLACGAASILQPALGRVGGILEAKKIAAMAEAHYAQIAPHLYCGPVEGAANVHLATCIPNFLILESIERWDGFHGQIVSGIRWEDGYVIPPTGPGLGIEFDEELARAHPYTGDELHLEMGPSPCEP